MSFLLTGDFNLGLPQAGEIRQGQVVARRSNEVLVDIGAKTEGVILANEIDNMDPASRQLLSIGNQVTVYVVNPEDDDGNIILSFTRALEEEDWERVQQLLDSQEVYAGKIVGYNKGGVLVRVGRVRGFIPASQLSAKRQLNNNRSAAEDRLRAFVGDDVLARVIEVDRERNRLILSERAAMKEIRAAQRNKLLDELKEGDVRTGRVVNLADFGAFVDLGGVEGLVHLSELSWKRVAHPSELLEVGAQTEVYVLNVDKERNRIGLSLKRLEPDPWTAIDSHYKEGELVEATITKLTKYGAFARLNDGYELEGLIHISELSEDRIGHPQEVVEEGQRVTARIIRIDPKQRQLGLSLKQVASSDFLESDLATTEEIEE
ncbi:MAG: 30S ribosomal protein S1 [Candidatus Promineifilaceae bacterium]